MKYILAIILTPTFGGPHNQIFRLNDSLKKAGYQYIVLTPDPNGTGTRRLKEKGIKVINRELHRPRKSLNLAIHFQYFTNFFSDIKFIQEVIVSNKIDLVQLCGLFNIQGAIAANRSNKPVVWQLLSNFAPKWLRNLLSPFVKKHSDVIMTTGLQIAKEHGDIAKFNNLIPFYPPVDCNSFKFDEDKKKMMRGYLDVPNDAFLIGTIGNQNRQKAHENFVKICDRFKQKAGKDGVFFRVIGNKTESQWTYYKSNVIDLIEAKGLGRDGFLTVSIPKFEISDYLSAFDVFLLSSKAEGVPTVILESMASSLPIVTSDVGAISEVVKDMENGCLYQLDDLDKAVDYLIQLSLNQNEIERIGELNKCEALEKYDVSECARIHISAFKLAMDQS
ncbi:glycosyltransferase family 4 protein [Algoriphagus halophilus]|uniref:Glycosyltransferase involved in cell wall bisynthesis n=1 Tax=Algoriphagus halophilus TaxID=226505 RepID=A0A1N6E980_9BACT|nr:glycosyltransferase family 4 protein [Algoriphagus halophilus]SIN79584.1 Glycosyltransferase involved in cell wall bisynthesis [Algoriphagus halophilus]